jgi:hypothetical protein
VSQHRLAYIAQGKLHLHEGDGTARILDSEFGCSLRERAFQIQNRRAWKTRGFGAQFMRLNERMQPEADANDFSIIWTSVARGCAPGEVLYSLETAEISGVFAVDSGGSERRLFHTADFRVRDLAAHPDGTGIAVSVSHGGMDANIAVLNGDGSNLREVSEGDSLDMAPHWYPGPRRRLVFQSAGLGRGTTGRLAGRGPFTIRQLDLESGELTCLAEDPDADFLGPQLAVDGTLYYVRRPYGNKLPDVNPLDALQATLMLPFRMAFGILNFLSAFAMLYSGRQQGLTGLQKSDRGAEQIRVWGETIPVGRTILEKRGGEADAPSLVPASWQLMRQSPAGREVLADGVLSFDIAPDGAILCSNGRGIHRIAPDGQGIERIFVGDMIEQVAAL